MATGIPGFDEWDAVMECRDLRTARRRFQTYKDYSNSKFQYRITHNGEVVE